MTAGSLKSRVEQLIAKLGSEDLQKVADREGCDVREVRKVWREMCLIHKEELDAGQAASEATSNTRSGKIGGAKRAEPKRLERSNPALAPTGTSSRG